MKILAVDTSTTSCSVAVVNNDLLLAEMTIDREQTHSKHLMAMVNTVIEFSGLAMADLDGFAVTKGPGTFTGLRIGISTVKGLAVACGKPIVGVSSLDALARQCAGSVYFICVLLDARKGEVYFSGYKYEEGVLQKKVAEGVMPPRQAVRDINEPSLLVGNGARVYRDELMETLGESAYFALPFQNTIRASTIAGLSMERFETSETDDIAVLVPLYIRKSDAELQFAP